MNLFITGASGFLGKHLINELVDHYETIYVLTRKTEIKEFEKYKNIFLLKGDITNPNIFEDLKNLNLVAENCQHIIHAAALYEMNAFHEDCYLQNVVGTQNIIYLARTCKKLNSLYYISTIAVADNSIHFLEENSLPKGLKFNDHYSKTKYLAEKMLRDHFHLLNCNLRIIRPGIIVGDSKTGKIDKVDGPYFFINAIKKYQKYLSSIAIVPLSFNPLTRIPMIPVDHCANLISLIIKRDNSSQYIKTFHLISDEIPTIQDFLEDLCRIYNLKIKFFPISANLISNTIFKAMGIPEEVIPFMFSKITYDKTLTNNELPEIFLSKYSQYKKSLLKK